MSENSNSEAETASALASQQRPEMTSASSSSAPEQRLAALRASIDNIDAALIHVLAERFRCTQEVGRLKAEYAMPASDPDREARQIARLRALAEDAHLDPEFAEKWFNFVVAEVIQHHTRIADEADSSGV